MSNEAAQAGGAFLTHLLGRLGHDLEVKPQPAEDDTFVMKLEGDASALGSRQDLVGALSQLTGQVISRVSESRARCVLDVGGQHEKRQELLEIVADDVAATVEFTGKRAILDGLDASARRVVHAFLSDDDRVGTRSEGEANNRLLLIEKS